MMDCMHFAAVYLVQVKGPVACGCLNSVFMAARSGGCDSVIEIIQRVVHCPRRAVSAQKDDSVENVVRWKRLIKRVRKVRFLQRVFAYTGHYLRSKYSTEFLQKVVKAQWLNLLR